MLYEWKRSFASLRCSRTEVQRRIPHPIREQAFIDPPRFPPTRPSSPSPPPSAESPRTASACALFQTPRRLRHSRPSASASLRSVPSNARRPGIDARLGRVAVRGGGQSQRTSMADFLVRRREFRGWVSAGRKGREERAGRGWVEMGEEAGEGAREISPGWTSKADQYSASMQPESALSASLALKWGVGEKRRTFSKGSDEVGGADNASDGLDEKG